MENYETLARFYDPVQGERVEAADYVQGLIARHQPEARSLLELGCGTGSILKYLAEHYDVVGLDLSEPMLALARAKLPTTQLVQGDMTDFALGQVFDVVICIYEALNHLLEYAQWEAVFDRSLEHLAADGLFLCDFATPVRRAHGLAQPPEAAWFGDDHLFVLDASESAEGGFAWQPRVFEHLGQDEYRLHHELVEQSFFPTATVQAALEARFSSVQVYDRRRPEPTSESQRLHFACRR